MLSALTPYFNNNEALLTSMLAYIVHDTFAGEGEEEITGGYFYCSGMDVP